PCRRPSARTARCRCSKSAPFHERAMTYSQPHCQRSELPYTTKSVLWQWCCLSPAHSPALPSLSGSPFPLGYSKFLCLLSSFPPTLHHLHASTSAEPKSTAPLTKNRKGN